MNSKCVYLIASFFHNLFQGR